MPVGPVRRDDGSADFFDGTARGELLLRRCSEQHWSEPQAEQCTTCGRVDLDRVTAAGGASVVSWAVTHGKPKGDQPGRRSVLVIAELDEGPWWWSQVVDADPEAVGAGTRLLLDFQRPDDEHEAVPVFRLAQDA